MILADVDTGADVEETEGCEAAGIGTIGMERTLMRLHLALERGISTV